MNPATYSLARQVAEKCGGLPLYLVTVGQAMARALEDSEWVGALETLKGAASEVEEIEKVRKTLKFSYDRLKVERHRKCLLYCSLFLEGCDIRVHELIEYWVGEGFLEKSSCSISTARGLGQTAITALKTACLLEDGHETKKNIIHKMPEHLALCDVFFESMNMLYGEMPKFVKLHGMVRDMALRISNNYSEKDKEKFFVVDRSEIPDCAEMSEKWTDATRISLMSNGIRELPPGPVGIT